MAFFFLIDVPSRFAVFMCTSLGLETLFISFHYISTADQMLQWRERLLEWQNPKFPGNYRQTIIEAFTQEDWERLWRTKTKWDEQITDYEKLEVQYDLEREQWNN